MWLQKKIEEYSNVKDSVKGMPGRVAQEQCVIIQYSSRCKFLSLTTTTKEKDGVEKETSASETNTRKRTGTFATLILFPLWLLRYVASSQNHQRFRSAALWLYYQAEKRKPGGSTQRYTL